MHLSVFIFSFVQRHGSGWRRALAPIACNRLFGFHLRYIVLIGLWPHSVQTNILTPSSDAMLPAHVGQMSAPQASQRKALNASILGISANCSPVPVHRPGPGPAYGRTCLPQVAQELPRTNDRFAYEMRRSSGRRRKINGIAIG